MNEREEAHVALQKELGKSQAFERLSQTGDFKIFREFMEQKKEQYRDLLEVAEDEKLSTVRGGLIALREILDTFDVSIKRMEELQARINELDITK